jgi:transcriptional regulator with XRE-family HTH domain
METYAGRLSAAMREQGLTQGELADAIGIPKRTLQEILAEKTTTPQRETRRKIEAFFGMGTPEEARVGFRRETRLVGDMFMAFVDSLPEDERDPYITGWLAYTRSGGWRLS